MPFDFVQHKEPKLLVDGLTPAEWPPDPSLEWCPPGHGDIYPALMTSGMLDDAARARLPLRVHVELRQPRRGARPAHPRVVAAEELPYVAEVTERTEADKKGGHIAVLKETGGLILRETAQTPDEDMDAFTDVDRHPYFHVNNLWVDLRALDALLRERDGVLGLPMIVNEKTVDPATPRRRRSTSSRPRWAPRSACSRGARAIRVPRAALRAGQEDERPARAALRRLPASATARGSSSPTDRSSAPLVELDDDHFKLLDDFDAHFPAGPPSLVPRPSGSRSTATSRSAATWSCAAWRDDRGRPARSRTARNSRGRARRAPAAGVAVPTLPPIAGLP